MYIKIKAFPSSKKESLIKKSNDKFLIHTKEPAERNLANMRIVLLIAEYFKVPTRKVRIISGYHSRSKIVSVDAE